MSNQALRDSQVSDSNGRKALGLTQGRILQRNLLTLHWENREVEREGRTNPGIPDLVIPGY